MPEFSIIIPVKPGVEAVAVKTICELALDKKSCEVLLVEGCAPSRQRNLAAREASGDILYFLDDDSILGSANFSLCRSVMEDTSVGVVGGPSLTPSTDTWLQKLFGSALESPFGSGPVRNRYRKSGILRETTEKELILCNLAVRKSVFLELGGFDERLYPNEENELLDRIRESGLKLFHCPEMYVYRSQRSSIRAFIRQMYAYGRGRAQQTLLTRSFSVTSFIPLIFAFYLVSALVFASHALVLLPLIIYVVLAMFFTVTELSRSRSLSTLLLILVYPLMHIVNGIGLAMGLMGGKPASLKDSEISVKKIQIPTHDHAPQG